MMKKFLAALALMTILSAAFALVEQDQEQHDAVFIPKQTVQGIQAIHGNQFSVVLSDGNILKVEVLAVQHDPIDTFIDMNDVKLCNPDCNYNFMVEQGLMRNVHDALVQLYHDKPKAFVGV